MNHREAESSVLPTEAEKVRLFNRRLADAYARGEYEEAYHYALQAMISARSAHGEESAPYATIANNTAMLLRRLGRLSEAETFARLALKVSEHTPGKEHEDYATNLNNLGLLLIDLGRYEEAEGHLTAAAQLRKERFGEASSRYAASRSNLGILYREMGRYDSAVSHMTFAMRCWRDLLGEDCPEYANSVTNLGAMYHTLGHLQEAETLLRQAVAVYAKLLGTDHPDYINALSNLGTLLMEAGKYQEAEEPLERVLQRQAVLFGTDHPDYALSLSNLAGLYLKLGRIEQAVLIYQKVIDLTRQSLSENHPRYAAALNNLALAHCDMGEYDKAEPLYREALLLQAQIQGEQHPDYALSVNNLGYLLYYTHRYEEAIHYMQEARAIQKRRLKPDHPDRMYTEGNLASAYLALGRYTEAEPLYRNRLRLSRKLFGDTHVDYTTALNNLAFLEAAQGRYKQALTRLKRIAAIENSRMAGIFAISSESQRLQFKIKLYTTYHAILALVVRHLSHDKSAVQCAADIVLQRKALTAEPSLVLRHALLEDRYPALQEDFRRLSSLKQQIPQAIHTLERKDLASAEREQWTQHLDRWQREQEDLEKRLARHIPEIGLQASLTDAHWTSIVAQLPRKTRLVEFARYFPNDFYAGGQTERQSQWGQARFAAFVFAFNSTPKVSVVDLGEAEPIETLVTAYLERLTDSRAAERLSSGASPETTMIDLEAAGTRLAATILHPLLPLPTEKTHLILSPDGILHLLPFETLLSPEEISAGVSISYLNTGRELLEIHSHASDSVSAAPFLVVAPDYDLTLVAPDRQEEPSMPPSDLRHPGGPYRALANAHIERSVLRRHFDSPIVEKAQATEGYVKSHCRRPSILHISTHGEFKEEGDPFPERPHENDRLPQNRASASPLLRSWLVMAGANSWIHNRPVPPEVEDGKLTAEDVSGLDLLGTDLVVLSACRSGLGGVVPGEGVFGLRRAFLQAGAKTLVVSLWSVAGLSTAWLLEQFYERLLRHGEGRDQALRSAQKATREASAHAVSSWLKELESTMETPMDALSIARFQQWRFRLQRLTPSHRLFAHPYYWAGFLCIGATGPLQHSVLTSPEADR